MSKHGISAYGRESWRGLRVGLLGGSFNPAHEGHRYISLEAMRALQLDAVWWLVSPQNPLKSATGMALQSKRLESAQRAAQHPRIFATDIETAMGTQYTVDTLKALQTRFSETQFVWLMGTDNLRQFHRWKNWRAVFNLVPVCVINRPPAQDSLRGSPAWEYAHRHRLPAEQASLLTTRPLPAWVILPIARNAQSSTAIRAMGSWR